MVCIKSENLKKNESFSPISEARDCSLDKTKGGKSLEYSGVFSHCRVYSSSSFISGSLVKFPFIVLSSMKLRLC
jgi:hypothetical protein